MALTEIQVRRLARLRNRHTLYEIAMELPDGRKFLAFYGATSAATIIRGLNDRLGDVASVMGRAISEVWVEDRKPGRIELNGAAVYATGRTQRDAIIDGDLPWIGDVAKAAA